LTISSFKQIDEIWRIIHPSFLVNVAFFSYQLSVPRKCFCAQKHYFTLKFRVAKLEREIVEISYQLSLFINQRYLAFVGANLRVRPFVVII